MEGGEERKKRFAERSLWAAQPHEGVSEPAVDTCCLISAVAIRKAPASPNDCRSPVWNTGCLCGNECCRSCRSKNTRLAQCYQHGSTTERKSKKGNMFQIFDFKKGMGKIEIKLQFSPCLNINNRSKTAPHNMREKAKFWWRSGRDSNPRPPA